VSVDRLGTRARRCPSHCAHRSERVGSAEFARKQRGHVHALPALLVRASISNRTLVFTVFLCKLVNTATSSPADDVHHYVIPPKFLFITTALKTSNPTQFYCCLCIRYRGNVSAEPLPSNGRGNFYPAVAQQRYGAIHRHTHKDSNVIS
jgi:hypothetical protein